MTLHEIQNRAQVAHREHPSYGAFVNRSVDIMMLAYEYGWKVACLFHDARAVRNAESLLGVLLRTDFAPSTERSRWIENNSVEQS